MNFYLDLQFCGSLIMPDTLICDLPIISCEVLAHNTEGDTCVDSFTLAAWIPLIVGLMTQQMVAREAKCALEEGK